MKESEIHRKACLRNLEKATEANRIRYALRQKTYFNCKSCGVATICRPSHLVEKVYCSMSCMSGDYKSRMGGTSNPNWRDLAGEPCAGCGQLFLSYNKKRKYCSRDCHQKQMSKHYGPRLDSNHKEIFGAMRGVGAPVYDLSPMGRGVPDGIAWVAEQWRFFEIKNPTTPYGRAGLSPRQKKWLAQWRGGPVYILSTVDDGLAFARGNLEAVKSTTSEECATELLKPIKRKPRRRKAS